MLPFACITCKQAGPKPRRGRDPPDGAFVGLRKEVGADGTELVLRVPVGVDLPNTPNAIRNAFFLLYRVVRQRLRNRVNRTNATDGASHDARLAGAQPGEEADESLAYHTIDAFERVLSAADEPQLQGRTEILGASETINWNNVDKHLHDGVFFSDDNSFYLNRVTAARSELRYSNTPMKLLYCFILAELLLRIERDAPSYVMEQADDFRELYHLPKNTRIYDNVDQAAIFQLLQEAFERADRVAAVKDAEYYRIHDAVYAFLYPQSEHQGGVIFGLSCFWHVWEEACIAYMHSTFAHLVMLHDATNVSAAQGEAMQRNFFLNPLDPELSTIGWYPPGNVFQTTFSAKPKRPDMATFSLRSFQHLQKTLST